MEHWERLVAAWPWLAAGAAAGVFFWRVSARWLRRQVQRHRFARARQGERDAESLLRSLGYDILGRQVPREIILHVDGQPLRVALRADYLVTQGRRRLVAEVKTGRHAPQLETAATRRQLLEYHLAYDADAALLVDMEEGRVREVRFPRRETSTAARAFGWLLAGAALGALAATQLR